MVAAASRTDRLRGVLGTLLAAVLVGVATAALAWWRLGPVTRGTVWAEDGGIFLRDRIALGPVDSLLHPYAGYLHLVPRLLVDLGWAFPVADYAHVLSAGACLVVGVLAGAVFVCARDVVPAWPFRVLLALLPALLPLAPYEISGNAANLHWFMLFAAPWLFAYRSRSWWGSGAVAALTVFVVLTELQTVLFLPLLLLAWFPLRTGGAGAVGAGAGAAAGAGGAAAGARAWLRAVPVTVVALAGGTAQVVTALTDQRTSAPGSPAFADVVAGWLLQPLAGLWNPDVGAAVRTVVTHGWAVVAVPALFLVAVLLAAIVVGTWRARWTVLALAAASGGVWWAALLANGGAAQAWAHPVIALAAVPPQRYAAASGLLLLAAVVVAASVLVGSHDRSGTFRPSIRPGGVTRLIGTLAAWCVVGLVIVATVGNVAPGPTRRSDGPVWAAQIPAAVAACDGDRSRTVEVRKAPWTAQVPCAMLLGR
ncbi:hypothetical protein DEJ28_11755 [Curtobacterium sp. MCPF17_002]|uniref:hypothetical protein n=1 Tax=Curtobacterium sp. MCPF17_002 TaxID=2175645 RepID=UPI0015E8D146|nr:hypothetical protein [Curtobacterium sp. MCPF17_002]WIB76339.1 hypothetical protein DEJ28_11755 [Curtobacterium sp. MCPF17_002]